VHARRALKCKHSHFLYSWSTTHCVLLSTCLIGGDSGLDRQSHLKTHSNKRERWQWARGLGTQSVAPRSELSPACDPHLSKTPCCLGLPGDSHSSRPASQWGWTSLFTAASWGGKRTKSPTQPGAPWTLRENSAETPKFQDRLPGNLALCCPLEPGIWQLLLLPGALAGRALSAPKPSCPTPGDRTQDTAPELGPLPGAALQASWAGVGRWKAMRG
jgi:hypothetical protein